MAEVPFVRLGRAWCCVGLEGSSGTRFGMCKFEMALGRLAFPEVQELGLGCVKFEMAFGRLAFPGGSDGKESICQCRKPEFYPWVGKIPWRRAWQPTSVLWPGESRGTEELDGPQSMGVTQSRTRLSD